MMKSSPEPTMSVDEWAPTDAPVCSRMTTPPPCSLDRTVSEESTPVQSDCVTAEARPPRRASFESCLGGIWRRLEVSRLWILLWQPRCHWERLPEDRWLCVPAFRRVCPWHARTMTEEPLRLNHIRT